MPRHSPPWRLCRQVAELHALVWGQAAADYMTVAPAGSMAAADSAAAGSMAAADSVAADSVAAGSMAAADGVVADTAQTVVHKVEPAACIHEEDFPYGGAAVAGTAKHGP